MLVSTRLPIHYDLQKDILSFAITKQIKRRKKVKFKNMRFNRKLNDKKKNRKSMRILNHRLYINIEVNEYIEDKKKDNTIKREYINIEVNEYIEDKKKDNTIKREYINIEVNEYIEDKKKDNTSQREYTSKREIFFHETDSFVYDHNINDTMISSNQKLQLLREENEERELLVSGLCRNIIPQQIHYNIFKTLIITYLRPFTSSYKTPRAIASTKFVTEIIDNFQRKNKCPFVDNDINEINLLDYIYIHGGSLRDIMLNRNINDIDIVIDINKLTKQYYYHLKTYHYKIEQQSINCQCYLWQRYIKMYKQPPYSNYTINRETETLKKFEMNIARCPFLLNNVFFKNIIIESMYNNSLLSNSIENVNRFGYRNEIDTNWVLNIIKPIKYNNINLKGSSFDIGMEKSELGQKIVNDNIINQCESWNKYFDYLYILHNPLYSDIITNNQKDIILEEQYVMNELKQNYDIINSNNHH
eukprot:240971_1